MARLDQGYTVDLEKRTELRENESTVDHPNEDSTMEEKFRVDRKKLEEMLQGLNLEASSNAEGFFDQIMKTTGAHISWPSRLKIGAKSRKDPHIKVAGKPDAVFQAKEKIMQVLDAKTNRVTLKIDVSHTDHSHAIGKGGRSVKEVSTDTQCHIHFPDSNRTNPMEKSNQVTISGLPEGVERARRRIRDMLPVIFCFDLPFVGLPNLLDVQRDTFLQQVEKQFDVQVTYKHRPKLTVCIKGVVENAGRTKEAANLVLKHHYREFSAHVPVSLSIEVDPKHLPFVRPQVEKVNLGATVAFPDSTAPANRKSTLTITGTIESVYEFRQYIVGCLPVFLIFDISPDDTSALESVENIEEKFDVNIIIKPRTKQQGKSVVIRTTERNVLALYESRCALLALDPRRDGNAPPAPATGAPLKAPAPSAPPTSNGASGDALTAAVAAVAMAQQQASQFYFLSAAGAPPGSAPTPAPARPAGAAPLLLLPSLAVGQAGAGGGADARGRPAWQEWAETPAGEMGAGQAQVAPVSGASEAAAPVMALSTGGAGGQGGADLPLLPAPIPTPQPAGEPAPGLDAFVVNSLSSSSSSSSGIESDADPATAGKQPASTMPTDRRAPGAEYSIKQRELRQRVAQTTDYDEKKAVARRKIRQELSSKPRIPNDEWVGQGFSFSLPTAALREATAAPCPGAATRASPANTLVADQGRLGAFPEVTCAGQHPHDLSQQQQVAAMAANMALWSQQSNGLLDDSSLKQTNGLFMQSCVETGFSQLLDKPLPGSLWSSAALVDVDTTSLDLTAQRLAYPGVPDLTEFLCKLGLGKYADILSQHEVDLPTFMTLSDNDLKELGINTFGARRKMLLAIQELQQLL